jgi:hypothetical protein
MISPYPGSSIFSISLWVSLQLFISSAFGIWSQANFPIDVK